MYHRKHQAHNPHIIAFAATSIDGRISLKKDSLPDWTSKEDWKFFQASLSRCDAIIVGRNTYTAARTRLQKRNTYVLTRSISRKLRRGSVTFINPSAVDILDTVRHHTTIAVLGGSSVYGMFFEAGIIDEVYVTIEPLVFGRGIPMVSGCETTIRMALCCIKKLNRAGTVLLHYVKCIEL